MAKPSSIASQREMLIVSNNEYQTSGVILISQEGHTYDTADDPVSPKISAVKHTETPTRGNGMSARHSSLITKAV